jgi:hypothetical protein
MFYNQYLSFGGGSMSMHDMKRGRCAEVGVCAADHRHFVGSGVRG